MHKKKASSNSSSLPSHSRPVEPKVGVRTLFGIGHEEVRKSIEALDKILDRYDGDGDSLDEAGGVVGGGGDRKYSLPKADTAAQLLASCMTSGGMAHRLRKSIATSGLHEGEELPLPPPPALLMHRHSTCAGSFPQNLQLAATQDRPMQRCPPPSVPKRGPDTKLSSTSSLSSTESAPPLSSQYNRDDIYESLVSAGDQKRHPESGYITPDQETIDSVFSFIHDRPSGGTRRLHDPDARAGSVGVAAGRGIAPAVTREGGRGGTHHGVALQRLYQSDSAFPVPPAEFSDAPQGSSSANEVFQAQRPLAMQGGDDVMMEGGMRPGMGYRAVGGVALDGSSSGRHVGPDVCRSVSMLDGSVTSSPYAVPAMSHVLLPAAHDSFLPAALPEALPYVIPPPPLMPPLQALPSSGLHEVRRQVSAPAVFPLVGVIPPPPPMENFLPPAHQIPPPTSPIFSEPLPPPCSSEFGSSSSYGGEDLNSKDGFSPTRLPPPPTMPKQLKKAAPPSEVMSLSVTPGSPDQTDRSALPFKVSLKSVPSKFKDEAAAIAAAAAAASDNSISAGGNASRSDDRVDAFPPPDFLPPPPAAAASAATAAAASMLIVGKATCQHQSSSSQGFPLAPPSLQVGQNPQRFGSIQGTASFPSPPAGVRSSGSDSTAKPSPPAVFAKSTKPGSGGVRRSDGGGTGSTEGLAQALQAVQLKNVAEQGFTGKSPAAPGQPGVPLAVDLVGQIQAGVQLRPSANGSKIRTLNQSPSLTGSVCSLSESTCSSQSSDILTADEIAFLARFSHPSDVDQAINFSDYPPPPDWATDMHFGQEASSSYAHAGHDFTVDITKLAGYQEVPPNCPTWKRSLIEKKNKQLEEDAMREHLSKKQEEERWRDIPEWKRNLIIEKEKKKQEELAPFQAERRRMEGEMERLQNLPEWKRTLIIKKRGDAI